MPQSGFPHAEHSDLGVGKGQQGLVPNVHIDQGSLHHLQHGETRSKVAEVLPQGNHILSCDALEASLRRDG